MDLRLPLMAGAVADLSGVLDLAQEEPTWSAKKTGLARHDGGAALAEEVVGHGGPARSGPGHGGRRRRGGEGPVGATTALGWLKLFFPSWRRQRQRVERSAACVGIGRSGAPL